MPAAVSVARRDVPGGLTSKRLLVAGGACALALATSFMLSRPDGEADNASTGVRPAAIPGVDGSAIETRLELRRAAALPALGRKPRPKPARRRRAPVAAAAPEPAPVPPPADDPPAREAAPPPPASTYTPPPAPVYEAPAPAPAPVAPAPTPAPTPAPRPSAPEPAPLEFDDSG
jgi:hypothetical protein